MKRILRSALCTLLCCAAIVNMVHTAAFAQSTPASGTVRERPALESMRVYVCGLLSARAFVQGDKVYMSLADVGEIYDIRINVSVTGGGFTASAASLELSAEYGSGYLTANCRYLYLPDGYIVCGEDVYLPLDIIERVFGISAEVNDGNVQISTAQVRMITGGEDYYETNFSADELYWLPHIAYVEAFEEPLPGIMGVISVVLNRVADEDFPDSIFEVLYDSKHTIQFTPAANGSMHGKPDEIYYIAAYLVLEGYDTVGKSLYFVNPDNNGNYWFRENLAYVTTIGDHEFYR